MYNNIKNSGSSYDVNYGATCSPNQGTNWAHCYPSHDTNTQKYIDVFSDTCYSFNGKLLKRREGIFMSFVGIVKCEDGFVGFGDSKSTVFDCYGFPTIDTKRSVRQKVFKNKNYILTTHGMNTMGKNNIIHYIDDWIASKINEFDKPFDFMVDFSTELGKIEDIHEFNFFIGYHDDNETYIQEFVVSRNNIRFSDKIFERVGDFRNNIAFYQPQFDELILRMNLDSVDNVYETLKKELPKLVKIADGLNNYNPVGLPFNFEILKF